MRWIGLTAAAALLAASAPGVAAPRKGRASEDPSRELCKSKPVIGSRVARKRECHTAQQWEEMALQDRLMMMTKQFNGDHAEAPADTQGFISPN
jgi:hypothetical protein